MAKRSIIHVDVNNAFLSWTAVDMLKKGYPIDIREIPSIIGGDEKRRAGIVLAKSPVAKKFGIVTAEPIYFARQKCPNLQIFPCDFQLFIKCSNDLYKILTEYTDIIERYSIDECFLDMTYYLNGRDLLDVAMEINSRVKKELGFTVNVGVAENKLLAKMASDFEKPDRVHTLYNDEIEEKMWPLPVSELFMLGKKTVPKLHNFGIKTIGDLAKQDKVFLSKKFGKHGILMWNYANGIDNEEVHFKREEVKSISNSVTLPKDVTTLDEIEKVLLALVEQVSYRLRKEKKFAKTINVQLRTNNFIDYSHQKSLSHATSVTKEIYNEAKSILHEMYRKEPIRLVSFGVSNLENKDEAQMSLFDENNNDNEKLEKLDSVMDSLKKKYGYNLITRARKIRSKRNCRGKRAEK